MLRKLSVCLALSLVLLTGCEQPPRFTDDMSKADVHIELRADTPAPAPAKA
ncbi:MAG: hypothetical protein ACREP7_04970 [Lysobacter sp.]